MKIYRYSIVVQIWNPSVVQSLHWKNSERQTMWRSKQRASQAMRRTPGLESTTPFTNQEIELRTDAIQRPLTRASAYSHTPASMNCQSGQSHNLSFIPPAKAHENCPRPAYQWRYCNSAAAGQYHTVATLGSTLNARESIRCTRSTWGPAHVPPIFNSNRSYIITSKT